MKEEIEASAVFIARFDESLNKFAQEQQMDIAIHFWNKTFSEVRTQYYSSALLREATANYLLDSFTIEIELLNLKRLLHVSMDGPNVNFKFHKDLDAYLLSKNDAEDPEILSMGSCGLHVAINGFKIGATATGWNMASFLRSIYNVFKNVPVRRNDYTFYSYSIEFPLEFAATRWLENGVPADRALKILPHLTKYVACLKKDKKEPDSYSYPMLVEGVGDKLMGAKLAFFST